MHALSTMKLLSVWEQGMGEPPLQRALTLLAAACPGTPPESLATFTIGQRDARLLALREETFGGRFTGLADCPACHGKIELAFDAADIRPPDKAEPPAELELQIEGRDLRFRLPTSADLLAVRSPGQLLGRCLLSGGNHFSERVVHAIAEKLSAADPMADVQFALSCAGCGHQWQAPFDIVAFFWSEISAAARNLLRDVHTLASAYSWTESEILALSPARRRFYLEMVNG